MVVAVVVISCEVEIIEMILGKRLAKWRYEDKYCLTEEMKASEQQSKLGKRSMVLFNKTPFSN